MMTSRTRLKLTMVALSFLMVMGAVAAIRKMDGVASASIAGVMTTLTTYVWAETKRPSEK
jgi:hypothetical protein